MRKTLIITMLLVCVMALSFALAGCGDGNEISININNKNMVTKLKGNIASASSFEMDLLQDVQGGQTHKSIKVKGNLAKVDSIEANNTTTTYYEFVDDYVNEYSLDAVTDKWKIKKITGEEVKYYDYKEYCTLNLELALMMPNFKYNASKKAFVGSSNGIDYEVKVEKDKATIKIGNTVGTEKYYSTATIGNLNGDIVITLPTIEEGAPSIFDGVDITTKAGIEAVKNAIVTAKTFINTHENHCDNKQYSGNPDFVQTSRFENMKGSVDIKSTAYNVNSYIDCSGDKAYLYEFDTNENKWYKSALSLNGYTPSQYFTSSYAENLALMDKAISASDLAYDSTEGYSHSLVETWHIRRSS